MFALNHRLNIGHRMYVFYQSESKFKIVENYYKANIL